MSATLGIRLAGVMFHRMVSPKEPFRGERLKAMQVPLPLAMPSPIDLPQLDLPPVPDGHRS